MASVLTQAPLPGPLHEIRLCRSLQKTVAPSSTTPTTAITLHAQVEQKAHIAGTTHLGFADAPEQRVPDQVFPATSAASSARFHHDHFCETLPSSFSDMGHYSLDAHTASHSFRNADDAFSSQEPPSKQTKYDDLADAMMREPPASKTVSIVAPSDLSHDHHHEDGYPTLNYAVSEPGHSSIYSASYGYTFSGRGPLLHTYTTQSLSGYPDSPHGCHTSIPSHRNSYPLDSMHLLSTPASFSSPSHVGRRKLRKPIQHRPMASASAPSPSSSSFHQSARLWRTLSFRTLSGTDGNPRSRKSSGLFSRAPHTISESGHGYPKRENATQSALKSHDSGGGGSRSSQSQSSATSHSSSPSSSLSSNHSTPATTPDHASPSISPFEDPLPERVVEAAEEKQEPPILPPQLSRRSGQSPARKLKKRRPPPSTSSSPQTHSLWRLRTQIQGHSSRTDDYGFLLPIDPAVPFGLAIQPKDLARSSRPSLRHAKRKSSTTALAQLAWTGLSSSELAALTSRLNIRQHSPERSARLARYEIEFQPGVFDSFGESLYASGGNPKSTHINDLGESKVDTADEAPGGNGSSLGNAVSYTLSTMRRKVGNSTRENAHAHTATASSPPPSNSHVDVKTHVTQSHYTGQHRSSRHYANLLESDPMAMRRWTLAMADVPDEILVQELDKLRKETANRRSRSGKMRTPTASSNGHSDYAHGEQSFFTGSEEWKVGGPHFQVGPESDSEDEEDDTIEEMDIEDDEEEWRAARRALLCCRELVRTERNYQARLRQLLNEQSSHPLFSLLLSYVPALIQASEALLVRLADDPSAWGVSTAFIGCEEELEAALVAWCGIVGEFFAESDEKDKRGRKISRKGPGALPMTAARSASQSGGALSKPKMAEHRRMSLIGYGEAPGSSGMFTAALGTGLAYGLSPTSQTTQLGKHGSTTSVKETSHSAAGTLTRTLSMWKRKSVPSSLSNLPTSVGLPSSPTGMSPTTEEKKLTVRDLAIQPTQRVMRYVLQYKDLLQHTPATSPSRGLVERALESALRIASKCDRAQGNSTFLRRP
ncbi:uncharacterized protein LAESUDRAFT_47174 [Laetiporus sulphureus 93-53]|uniref:DH domain-containing protein n=1 Tax=Laetiporus sulphureus 93-53 TaxID=1314785 RepID=A0A165F9V5_9APHY|nr:uncharacterized protein LAESUDRAFT_47174 [Laetiporus sulphureus 93-53]KZT08651.1 hypothetical protein LAESUDRAFT_47174 [Laetiporus sulphureus 93-53]